MHASSFEHMQRLVATYVADTSTGTVVDIGSYDVNGSYRPLFEARGLRYVGVDLQAGPNVDIVLKSPYRIPLPSRSVNVIACGQTFEHVERFWETWHEMVRVLRHGGLIFLIAPSRGPEHRFPVDCWRFYPDGFRALATGEGLEILEILTDWAPHADPESAQWGDTVGAFRKPVERGLRGRLRLAGRRLRAQLGSGRRGPVRGGSAHRA